jgi:transglutaminase/protease-like cytokinesis protein 3
MGPINNHIEQYKKENARLSSLSAQFREKAQFTGLRSTLTYPVSEMQTAFPEGVWAEEIVFSEAGPEAWNISIIAFSNSSGLIPELLKGLSAITGMDKVRMIYSEQTSVKSKTGERAIKLRVEGTYKKR